MSAQPALTGFTPAFDWLSVKDGNPTAMALFERHYTYRHNRAIYQFVGPGEKLVLLTSDATALFVWRKFRNKSGDLGINCAVFRNEGATVSSELITQAVAMAQQKWGRTRLYTYVNPKMLHIAKCRGLEYCHWPPGRCFLAAGWQHVRDDHGRFKRTKRRRLLTLELIV